MSRTGQNSSKHFEHDEFVTAGRNLESALASDEFTVSAERAVNRAQSSDAVSVFSVTIPFERIDPLAVLEILAETDQFQYYWEHPEEKLALAAGRAISTINAVKTNGKDRFEAISDGIKEFCKNVTEYASFRHSLAGVHFLGGFSFFGEQNSKHWKNFGTADFVVPEWTFIRDGELSLLTINLIIKEGADTESVENCIRTKTENFTSQLRHSTSHNQNAGEDKTSDQPHILEEPDSLKKWIANVEAAKEHIRSGDLDKIVLSRMVRVSISGRQQPTRVLNQLRKEYPSCYTFMMRPQGKTAFVGSTPEKLLSIRSNYILTEGLAGSISRGQTATEDAILEKKLLNSTKDLEEHRLVVDAIEERLREFSDEVNYPGTPGIKKFTNVQHLYTPISAWTNNRYNPFTILRSLHPTPAVGGVPVRRAVGLIPEYELYDRGWYAAPFGWLNSKGRGEFVVAIRSGLIMEHEAMFYAGCGIVQDSDPVSEWEETKLKLIPMLTAINHG